jgi:hypothetical protein
MIDRGHDSIQVLAAELFEPHDLSGKAAEPVRQAVRQRRVAEAAVSAARPERDPLAFEENDGSAWV